MICRPRSITSLLVLLLSLALAGCSKSPEEHFQQGKVLFAKGDHQGAILELKTTLQAQPDNGEARLLLGKIYLAREYYAEAEKELSKARQHGQEAEQVLPLLAKALYKTGEPQRVLDLGIPPGTLGRKALAALQATRASALLSLGKQAEADQAIAAAEVADADNPELLLLKARLAMGKQQNSQAMQLLDAALRQDDKSSEVLYLKAGLLRLEVKPDEAMRIYQRIVGNDPGQFQAYLAMSDLHLQAKNIEAADNDIKAAEKLAAKHLMVRYARGNLELQRGNLEKARSVLLDVQNQAPNHLPSAMAYAIASHDLGHYEQSIEYAGRVLGAAPANLIAVKILASSKLKVGDARGALKTLAPFLAKNSADANLLTLAGEAYFQTKDYNKAMAYLDKAAELDPTNAAIKTGQALGHLATGGSSEALANLEVAATLSDKPSQTDLALVILHMQGKAYDKALRAIANLEKKLPNNPVTHNLRAAALQGKQDFAGARKSLEQALAIQPTFLPAAINLARLDMYDQKPDNARKRFDPILAADKNNVKAMLALADLAAHTKSEKDYVDWLEKATKADPKALQAHTGLIRHYLSKHDNAKALSQAKQAAKANPDSLAALNLLGATQQAMGEKGATIATYKRMTQLAPQSPQAHLRLALALGADKQLGPARDTLKTALQLKPDFTQAQDALIQLELAGNKTNAALDIARQIQRQQPKSPHGFEREADILLSQKRHAQAIKAYEQALAKGAGTAVLLKLHRTLNKAGDSKTADQRLAGWLKLHPKDLVARSYAAEVYMLSKRNREAIAQYEELLKSGPATATALNNLASLYQHEHDNRALATAEQALKLTPDHPVVQDTLGWILVEQGQLPRALELLGKATTKAPKTALFHYHYGVALARAGKPADARKELQAAVTSGQKFPALEEAKALLKSL